jgi:hypothetical protein
MAKPANVPAVNSAAAIASLWFIEKRPPVLVSGFGYTLWVAEFRAGLQHWFRCGEEKGWLNESRSDRAIYLIARLQRSAKNDYCLPPLRAPGDLHPAHSFVIDGLGRRTSAAC